MSFERFLNDFYRPGRPFVLRNHVSSEEIKSFSKRAWSRLDHFHPASRHSVGVTAYPSLSMQEKCSHLMTIEQVERDKRCKDTPNLHMMHAEHQQNFHEAYAMYDGDPLQVSTSVVDKIRASAITCSQKL